jgi:hypothetical protein
LCEARRSRGDNVDARPYQRLLVIGVYIDHGLQLAASVTTSPVGWPGRICDSGVR